MKKVGKKKITQKEATVVVTTTVLQGSKEVAKKIKIRPFVTETATMGVKLGTTINLGDFSSARIDVFVSMPCYVEEALGALEQCYDLADKFLTKKSEEVKGGE